MNETHDNQRGDNGAVLDKIQKLLRLADRSRGATEHEAKVALAKAEELMTRHKIDLASLRMNAGEHADIPVGKEKVELPKTLNPADLLILSLLQSHFNVRVVIMTVLGQKHADLIGSSEDIAFASYAFGFLRQTFFQCWNEFKKLHEKPDRKSYYRGLYDGIKEAIESGKRQAEASVSEQERQCYQIALADTKTAITRYIAEHYPKLRNTRARRSSVNSESYHAGKARGASIRVNRPLE